MISVLLLDMWQTLATKRVRVFDVIQQNYSLPDAAFLHFRQLLLRMEIADIDEQTFWRLLFDEYDIPADTPKLS